MTDFDKVDVQDFLAALNIKVTSISGHNAVFACPWHADRHPSARMDLRTTMWLCEVCGIQGNAISFLARLHNIDNQEARDAIDQRYGAGPVMAIGELEVAVRQNLDRGSDEEEQRVLPAPEWADYFAACWNQPGGDQAFSYMVGRGFMPETLVKWKIGFDPLSRRVVIPVYDIEGQLAGFKARAIDPDVHPRYLIIGGKRYGFDTYHKSHHVFGLHRYRRGDAQFGAGVVIVEGELNVVAMDMKLPNCPTVGVAGSEFSDIQRILIVENCSEALIYFDYDGWRCTQGRHYVGEDPGPCQICGADTVNAGVKGASKVARTLLPYMPVSVVMRAPADAAELDADRIEALLQSAEPALTLAVRGDLPQLALT